MAAALVEDNAGKTIKLMEMDGHLYPFFPEDSLKHATEIEARPDDILLLTYPKSGTHWTATILHYLIKGTTTALEEQNIVDHFVDLGARDTINGQPSPRLLYSHFHSDIISQDFIRKNTKIIYVTRDPRDIVTSFFPHHKKLKPFYDYDGEWDGHLHLFLEGKMDYNSWFEHTKGWEKCLKDNPERPTLILSYESLIEDLFGNIKKMSDFIGTNHDEEFLKEVETRTSFKSMLGDIKSERSKVWCRKGKIGDWKNHFTVAQSEMFDDIFEEKMAGTDAYNLYSHTVEN